MRRATISFRMAISACAVYGFSRNYTLLIPGKAVAEADRRVANFRCFCKCSHGHTHINKINIMQLLQLKRNGWLPTSCKVPKFLSYGIYTVLKMDRCTTPELFSLNFIPAFINMCYINLYFSIFLTVGLRNIPALLNFHFERLIYIYITNNES
jgi:hypothetical protein